jgi:GR25 family glycosyltransferase involved in LPS biosynthesis
MLPNLGISNQRVRARSPADIDIPEDVSNPVKCNMNAKSNKYVQYQVQDTFSHNQKFRTLITGLCGRETNVLTELAVTVSHLTAIHRAIYSTTDKYPYALILEDDITIPFNIDFEALIRSAPANFTILQLFTSNDKLVHVLHDKYLTDLKEKPLSTTSLSHLWVHRASHAPKHEYWCAGAYIINKASIKPIIDRIVSIHPDKLQYYHMNIIAGFQFRTTKQCVPRQCCSSDNKFIRDTNTSCIYSPRGYSADHYIYSFNNAYILTIPLITSGSAVANNSTLHQHHVNFHSKAFDSINEIIKGMKTGNIPLPPFVSNLELCQ